MICPYNPRSLLIVCADSWMLFDPSDFTLICSVPCENSEQWLGGQFAAIDKVFCWCSDGVCYLHQLPRRKLEPNKELMDLQEPLCYCVVRVLPEELQLNVFEPVYFYAPGTSQSAESLLFRADSAGMVSIWALPEITDDIVVAVLRKKAHPLPELFPVALMSISKHWRKVSVAPSGIAGRWVYALNLEGEYDSFLEGVKCALYEVPPTESFILMGNFNYHVIADTQKRKGVMGKNGLSDLNNNGMNLFRLCAYNGLSVMSTFFEHRGVHHYYCHMEDHAKKSMVDLIMVHGNQPIITLLLVCYTVKLGVLFDDLTVEAIRASNGAHCLLLPKVAHSVCSIAGDGSVALLNLKERRCVLLASRHYYPVKNIYWRTSDDYLIVECEDRSAYVWQIETGHLDRVLTGLNAELVLAPLQQQKDIQKTISSSSILSPSRSSLFRVKYGFPLDFVTVKTKSSDFTVVLFNIESLILSLLTGEEGVRLVTDAEDRKEVISRLSENFKFCLQISRLFLSLFFGWGLNQSLSKDFSMAFGLRPPDMPVSRGFISFGGQCAFAFPMESDVSGESAPPKTLIVNDALASIAIVQTLLSMNPVLLLQFKTPSRLSFKDSKLPKEVEDGSLKPNDSTEETKLQDVLKRVKTFHYVTVPMLVDQNRYSAVRLMLLACRWMERCPQLREASQLFLSSELKRIGPNGRKILIDDWAMLLPLVVSPATSIFDTHVLNPPDGTTRGVSAEETVSKETSNGNAKVVNLAAEEISIELFESTVQRQQSAAVVLLALVGSQYGKEMQFSLTASTHKLNTVESFSAKNSSLAWTTGKMVYISHRTTTLFLNTAEQTDSALVQSNDL
ncbi:unnamed protein product [Soboliphyme baturini]|uniref:WD_REPEATS_REGION domain-containing protein n=1 Tax=Soboliphyme baturini TaxID=241478 RepID=A0A183IP94_9BILA|nr:unnamed protein product [Soboliphyme baturini]